MQKQELFVYSDKILDFKINVGYIFFFFLKLQAFLDSFLSKFPKKILFSLHKHASWSSGNAFVSWAGGLRSKSRAGQIGHSVAKGSSQLRHFLEKSCVTRAQSRRDELLKLVTRFGINGLISLQQQKWVLIS